MTKTVQASRWNPNRYPQTLLEAMTVHAFYLTLGYSADEIFIILSPEAVMVKLESRGNSFTYEAGVPEHSMKKMKWFWDHLMADWNRGGVVTQKDADILWRSSRIRAIKPLIMHELAKVGLRKGLRLGLPVNN